MVYLLARGFLGVVSAWSVVFMGQDTGEGSLPRKGVSGASGKRSRAELAGVWPPGWDVAELVGHEPKTPMKAIREKCLDCCCGSADEVRKCEATDCPLWPFRSGRHPYTSGSRAKAKTAL